MAHLAGAAELLKKWWGKIKENIAPIMMGATKNVLHIISNNAELSQRQQGQKFGITSIIFYTAFPSISSRFADPDIKLKRS